VEQQAFLENFTRTLLAAYGWAEKNTRPTFKTDEKKGSVLMAS
jgi:hypothetical protein